MVTELVMVFPVVKFIQIKAVNAILPQS